MSHSPLKASPLGQRSRYVDQYDKSQLFPMPRQPTRELIGAHFPLPFKGYDLWTAYEVSWLNLKGKPIVAVLDVVIPCESTHLIESKSFKLYLNSFNNTRFVSEAVVEDIIATDLSAVSGIPVQVTLRPASACTLDSIQSMAGFCLDELDVSCNVYNVDPGLLRVEETRVTQHSVYSHLLKSNCLVTGQPDWGSIQFIYSGHLIDPTSLLAYIVSFRNHNEFHEQCVERIFMDIMHHCKPNELTVYARYTRRGGLDINPIRSTKAISAPKNSRLFRQ